MEDLDAAAEVAQSLLWFDRRVGVGGVVPLFVDRLLADLMAVKERFEEWGTAVVVSATLRLATADGPSVQRYIRHVRAPLLEGGAGDVLRMPVVVRLNAALAQLRGLHAAGTPSVILVAEYRCVLGVLKEARMRCLVVVCWRRMARVADALEVRMGGLWPGPEALQVWVEGPWSKTAPGGAWDRFLVTVEVGEWVHLAPFLATVAPITSPLRRPLLFAGVRTVDVADALFEALGRRVGAHTLRRSALTASLSAGVPLAAAILLSGHASEKGAAPYVLSPDAGTAATMAWVSAATVAPAVWTSACPPEGRRPAW